jgi:dihydroorotate dehydrogenase (NAD+) catalytic subunit
MPDLTVKIGKLRLKNPVMAASGTFGPEYGELTDINKLGAYIAKTITLNARAGNPGPRVTETASGMLNAIGLENGGLDDFIRNKLPKLKRVSAPVIASIAGDDPAEFGELAARLDSVNKVAAIEMNLSCPNIGRHASCVMRHAYEGGLIAQDPKTTCEVIKAARKATRKTLIVKLSPNVTDIAQIALAAQDAGADAVSLVNTFLAIAIDIEKRRPVLGNITGGLSGPAIKPIALRMVREVYKKVDIPVVGIGGIMDYKDAVEFMLCGARAVQVGTANFADATSCAGIVKGLENYMKGRGMARVTDIVGALKA